MQIVIVGFKPTLRAIFIGASLFVLAAYLFVVIGVAKQGQLDAQAVLVGIFALLFPVVAFFATRVKVGFYDNYIEYDAGLPWSKAKVIRAVDVASIETMSYIFGAMYMVWTKEKKDSVSIMYANMERSNEIKALLEQSLKVQFK